MTVRKMVSTSGFVEYCSLSSARKITRLHRRILRWSFFIYIVMIKELQIRVSPQVAATERLLKNYLADECGIDARTINAMRILKRSIDARQKNVFVNLKVRMYVNEQPSDDEYGYTTYGDVSYAKTIIVVGAGPGGLFAALKAIERGYRPIVLERGKTCVNVRKTYRP